MPQQEPAIESRHDNPIEEVFGWMKAVALLPKATARMKEMLWKTIADLLDASSADECPNVLPDCGCAYVSENCHYGATLG